jgi:hypothetical protein
MTNITVNTSSSPKISATVSNQPQVITIAANAAQKISSLRDVDVLNAQHGALLQYDANLDAWVASNIIERNGLTINCGNY